MFFDHGKAKENTGSKTALGEEKTAAVGCFPEGFVAGF